MPYLVNWHDDWFAASIDSKRPDPNCRCRLQAANDPKLEALGFKRSDSFPYNKHYYKFLKEDPGLKYFSELKYNGYPVSLESIRAVSTQPRELCIFWSTPGRPIFEAELWEGDQYSGYHRYVFVDEIEKTKMPAPFWDVI